MFCQTNFLIRIFIYFIFFFIIFLIKIVLKDIITSSSLESKNWSQKSVTLATLSTFSTFGRKFHRTKHRGFTVYKNYSRNIFLNAPPVVWVPVVTPFMYSPKVIEFNRIEKIERAQKFTFNNNAAKKLVATKVTNVIYFEINYVLSYINNVITVCVGAVGLAFNSNQKLEVIILSS